MPKVISSLLFQTYSFSPTYQYLSKKKKFYTSVYFLLYKEATWLEGNKQLLSHSVLWHHSIFQIKMYAKLTSGTELF